MTFFVETRWGGSEESPSVERMEAILAELDVVDPEHPDTWLTHDSGWTLTAYESGLVILERDDDGTPPRHMRGLSRDQILGLWTKLAAGQLDEIEKQPWSAGNGIPPLTDAQKAEREALLLEIDRQFYDSLGDERGDSRCRAPTCDRGTVRASVFCRVHQFENVRGSKCPFTH